LFCAAGTASADLVSHWNFDSDLNDSAGSNNGTAAGNAAANATRTMIGGGALQLDGTGDWANVGSGATLNLTGSATISAWIYWTSGNIESVYSRGEWNQGKFLGIHGNANPPTSSMLWTSNPGIVDSSATLANGTWYQVTMVADAAGNTTKLYIDGKLDKSVSGYNANNRPSDATLIGAEGYGGGRWDIAGTIDDMGVYNAALSAKQIAATHAMGKFEALGLTDPGIASLLAAFDAGAGNSTTINGNTWTYTGGLTGGLGTTGGTAGIDAWVNLDSAGNGMQFSSTPTPQAYLLTFGLPGNPGVINNPSDKTITLTVPYGTNVTNLGPYFTTSAGATCYDADPSGTANVITTGAVRNFTTSQHYWVKSSDGLITNDYTVTVNVTPGSTACDMVSFEAAGVSGVITLGTPNTVMVTLPPGTEVSALTPDLVVSPLAGYTPAGAQDFTSSYAVPVKYTVTAEDGITNKDYFVTIIVGSPPNDDFVNAIALPGTSGIQTGTGNRYATLETDEPHAGLADGTNTVWFKRTAPSDGSYTVTTLGSTKVGGGEWDARLGIYTGSAVNALTLISGETDIDVEESRTATVTAGTTYHIQAAGYSDEEASNIKLTCTFVGTGTSYGTWETANGASGGANADSNSNGVPNGVEFFMGGTAASPATLSALVNTAGTWSWTIPYDPAALATYKFQVTGDLSAWQDVLPGDPNIAVLTGPDQLRLTLPADKRFCRLVVTTP
jgi:hypothetical protein